MDAVYKFSYLRGMLCSLALLKKQSDALCPLCEDEQETNLPICSLKDIVLQWHDGYSISNDHF